LQASSCSKLSHLQLKTGRRSLKPLLSTRSACQRLCMRCPRTSTRPTPPRACQQPAFAESTCSAWRLGSRTT
jgi:hypothetical protein